MVKVSVCIPVFGTERYLRDCLKSVAEQSFTDYEIIVVNDGSTGCDEAGLSCKKIVKDCKKRYSLSLTYIEHGKNLGVLEAHRTAVEQAGGIYIFNLDSDDTIPPNALELLYNKAAETKADIVHGITTTKLHSSPDQQILESEEKIEERNNRVKRTVSNIYQGVLENRAIFDGYLLEENHCGFLCAKLIRKDIYMEAFSHIPKMFCVMADDVIQYFWISYFAKKYVGIKDEVYSYNINTGISSHRIIKDLVIWSHVCSASSVFTALYNELDNFNIGLTEEEANKIEYLCYFYVENNLKQWNKVVAPEIKEKAYDLICEYWGDDLVQQVQQEMKSHGLL